MNGPLFTTAPKWYKSSDASLIRPRIHNMPASEISTQRTQALALLKRRGSSALDKARTTCSCPTMLAKLLGRHLRART